ncbi:carboxypeptidase-like regulatory domain-containing protein [Formosa sp. S-31]|uniref:carboxypeptidase-like regulatory domain-containing protein n=1 Tax=Formosa sp. S-31 TaxID=2790949 RepID=UPI003EBA4982
MKHHYTSLFILIFFPLIICAQTEISATIIDSSALKPIPFATIAFNKGSGVISNENGQFQLIISRDLTEKDSLNFSCLGYDSKQLAALSISDSLVYLQPKAIELNEVMLFNKNYTVEEIIEKAEAQIKTNYETDYSKSKLFLRESYYTTMIKKEVKIKKSTIPEFNQQFTDSLLNHFPNQSDYYNEILAEHYKSKTNTEDDETEDKLNIIKASHLYDKDSEISFNAWEDKFNNIIKKRIKRDSYFKIKSGIFGTKEELDSSFYQDKENKNTEAYIEEQKKIEADKKKNFLKYRKQSINNLEHNSFFSEASDLNMLYKSNRYHFKLLDYSFLNNQYVYKIAFAPKRSETYQGILYINTEDFAVIRLEYTNVKSLKSIKFLGISFNDYLKKGLLIYVKNASGTYSLQYAESENAQKAGIDRPLKIIEKNKHVKGRRKQNEVAADINFIISNSSKKQMVVFENTNITPSEFENFKEQANQKPVYLPAYDPEFWNGYNIIEPNQAIKDFKSLEADNL